MRASDYRANAWQKMSNKWGTMAITTLCIALLSGVPAMLDTFFAQGSALQIIFAVVGVIASVAIAGAFVYAQQKFAYRISKGDEIDVSQIFDGFKDYMRATVAWIICTVFTFLWSLLLIVPGIIKSLSYSMTYFIMLEDPNIAPNDARKKSMQMMEGHKWQLFCLQISFIGWILLSILTLGILLLWINPFIDVAMAEFYNKLKNPNEEVVIAEAKDVENPTLDTVEQENNEIE